MACDNFFYAMLEGLAVKSEKEKYETRNAVPLKIINKTGRPHNAQSFI